MPRSLELPAVCSATGRRGTQRPALRFVRDWIIAASLRALPHFGTPDSISRQCGEHDRESMSHSAFPSVSTGGMRTWPVNRLTSTRVGCRCAGRRGVRGCSASSGREGGYASRPASARRRGWRRRRSAWRRRGRFSARGSPPSRASSRFDIARSLASASETKPVLPSPSSRFSAADDEPLDPASSAGGLDDEVEPLPVAVEAGRGGTDEGGRQGLVGVPASGLVSRCVRGEVTDVPMKSRFSSGS